MYHQHCVKVVRIRGYSGPYWVRMQENTDQINSEYGHFSRGAKLKPIYKKNDLKICSNNQPVPFIICIH